MSETPMERAKRAFLCRSPHLCADDWHAKWCPARNRPAVAAEIEAAVLAERGRILAAIIVDCPCCCTLDDEHADGCTYASDCPVESEERDRIIGVIRGEKP